MPAGTITTKKASKKTTRRRMPYRRTVNSVQAAKIARKVATSVATGKIEKKVHFRYVTPVGVDATGTIFGLSDLIQGVGTSGIIGSRATLDQLLLRYAISVGDETNFVRLILFQDKDAPLVGPGVGEVLKEPNQPIVSLYNNEYYGSRFKILFDKVITVDDDDRVYTGYTSVSSFGTKYLKFAGDPLSASSQASGHLFLLAISDSAAVSHPSIEFNSMLGYRDA